jgi:hypothetical protein
MRTAKGSDGSSVVMELLRQGISLTLLVDLVDPYGPASAEVYAAELAVA